MGGLHVEHVQRLLGEAEVAHLLLLQAVPQELRRSLPVDAQGITRAIDYLAEAAGFTAAQRRDLVASHAINPAVMHARVFGREPLTEGTVLGAYVDGARVRAGALVVLAQTLDPELSTQVQLLLTDHPLPSVESGVAGVSEIDALKDAYAAQESAAMLIAEGLDVLQL